MQVRTELKDRSYREVKKGGETIAHAQKTIKAKAVDTIKIEGDI
jgi:hypothetical protein